jgi:hypothetical protein
MAQEQRKRRHLLQTTVAFTAAVLMGNLEASALGGNGAEDLTYVVPVSRVLTAAQVRKLLAASPVYDSEVSKMALCRAYRLAGDQSLLVFHNGSGRLYESRTAMLEAMDVLERGGTAAEEPWESRRGVRTTDYNNSVVLIRASIDEVGRSLTDLTERWERDVLGKEIVVGDEGAFIFRLRGHSWTEVVIGPLQADQSLGLWERELSSRLATRVITYSVSDTMGAIGYDLYERGELLEKLDATDDGSGKASRDTKFSSRLRPLKRNDITDIWSFTEEFLVAQDAFEPGIEFTYFLGRQKYRPGDRLKVVNPGFPLAGRKETAVSILPIERVDYLALRQVGR